MADILLSGSVGAGGAFAILGRANVEILGNADLVLSLAQYSNYFVQVTSDGTSTGVRNVIAPLNEGASFVVLNKTSEGFAIVLKGPTGTGVSIPPASSALVATDGTNYFTPSAGTGFSPALIVPTIAALGAVSTVALQTSYPAIVQSVGADWTFEATGALPVDGITVIAATPAGQWWRGATRIAQQALRQTAWTVDPQNVAASDENAGTGGAPLKNWAEIVRRLGTDSPDVPFAQSIAVTLASAQNANTDPIFFAPRVSGGGQAVLSGTRIPFATAIVAGVVTPKNRATPQLLTIAGMPVGTTRDMMVENVTRGGSLAIIDSMAGAVATMQQPLAAANFAPPTTVPGVGTEDDTWATGDTLNLYTLPACNLKQWRPISGDVNAAGKPSCGWTQFITQVDSSTTGANEYTFVADGINAMVGCVIQSRIHMAFFGGRGQGLYLRGCSCRGQVVMESGGGITMIYGGGMAAGVAQNTGGPLIVDGDAIVHGAVSSNSALEYGNAFADGVHSIGIQGVSKFFWTGTIYGPASVILYPQSVMWNFTGGTFVGNMLWTGTLRFGGAAIGNGATPPVTSTFVLNGVTPVNVVPAGGQHFPANAPIAWSLKTVGGTPGTGAPFMSAAVIADQFTVQSPTAGANDTYQWEALPALVPITPANIDLYGSLIDVASGARFCTQNA